MGAIADAMVAYAQPLLAETDGSEEQMQKALAMTQLCWNLAILSNDEREEQLGEIATRMGLNDAEFEEVRRDVINPMILRHHEMFPRLRRSSRTGFSPDSGWPDPPATSARPAERYPGTDRYAPCPCNSGRKYKFCCGATAKARNY